jgi:cytochrome c oxidase cbb3-type subunit 3
MGVMPGWGPVFGDAGVEEVLAYVQSLTGTASDPALVQAGAVRYATFCVACHGADAKGNPALGAPSLADNVWLYGSDVATLRKTLAAGRQGQMPAHEALLGKDRVRLMAAYVLSLGAPTSGGSNGSADGG